MMATPSNIEWTEQTWNPIVGCTVVSPGCTNCYAMKMAGRVEATGHPSYQGLTVKTKSGFVWTGNVALNEKALIEPLRRRKPTTYFVNSMGDLFHESVPDEWIDRVFAVMALCPQHTFQCLTKRSDRMREYKTRLDDEEQRWERIGDAAAVMVGNDGYYRAGECQWPLPNVWLGVSVEDQARADERIPDLLATPAAVRWISCEPLLGPVNLEAVAIGKREYGVRIDAFTGLEWDDLGVRDASESRFIDWVVCGGESGPGARPMHPDWARSLRDQCAAAGVPFFFKQWGEWGPVETFESDDDGPCTCLAVPAGVFEYQTLPAKAEVREFIDGGWLRGGGYFSEQPEGVARVGKKRAGRLLDGVLHDAMPPAGEPA